jgi:hypothetical protein
MILSEETEYSIGEPMSRQMSFKGLQTIVKLITSRTSRRLLGYLLQPLNAMVALFFTQKTNGSIP